MFFTYKITNKINNKIYIGKCKDVNERWYKHKYDAKHKSKSYFQKALIKYGFENFELVVLGCFETDADACNEEIRLIANQDKKNIYNIAKGGNGGLTMSLDKINEQYSIPKKRYEEFMKLFYSNKTQIEISILMNVGKNSVKGCAKRLGLSFQERRKVIFYDENKPILKSSISKSKSKFSKEERHDIWSKNIIELNKKRGVSDKIKNRVINLYFIDCLKSFEISILLNIPRSTIRGIVNRYYKSMDIDSCEKIKKQRALNVKSKKQIAKLM